MARVLLVCFLVVPVMEIALIIQVGQLIGVVPTVVLLVAESVLGAFLVRREGRRVWQGVRAVLAEGRSPEIALTDAGLVLVGGTLLLTPGFVTDVVGFCCILPFTRPAVRRLVRRAVARQAARSARVRLVDNRRVE